MSLKSILTDPGLTAATVDALIEHYVPLLKNAAQYDLLNVLALSKYVVSYRAAGNDAAAASTLNTINFIIENNVIEAKYETQDLISEAIPAMIVALAKVGIGAVV